jgi:hypothetical protein
MEELLKLLGFTTPLIYAGAAYGLFHWLDENASDEAKALLTRTMRLRDYKNEQVASALVEVFDRIYTYPLLRWRAFLRSLLFTTVVSAIFVFELRGYFFDPEDLKQYPPITVLNQWEFVLVGLLFNVFTDYLSLFVIRAVLIRSGTKPVIGLALGTLSGVAIVLAANFLRLLAVMYYILATLFAEHVPFWSFFWAWWGYMQTYDLVIFALPALAVFTWLPLFALGILIARLLTPLSWIVGRTQWFLKEGKEHPLKAIGYVAAVVVFLGTVAGRLVFSA